MLCNNNDMRKIFFMAVLLFPMLSSAEVVKLDDGLYLFRGLISYFPSRSTIVYSGKAEDIAPYKGIVFKPGVMTDARFERCAKSPVEIRFAGKEMGQLLILSSTLEVISVGDAQWTKPPTSP